MVTFKASSAQVLLDVLFDSMPTQPKEKRNVRAARLHQVGSPLRIEEVPRPRVQGSEVLIRVAGAGVCQFDVHIRSGRVPLPKDFALPLTMGHENAGIVEETGPLVREVAKGDAVGVWGGRGCGTCRVCRQADEQVCGMEHWILGGYAEVMRVPHERFLVKLDSLDPVEAAPLTDAGLTSYHAIKKTLSHLHPGAFAVVIGIGGLGHIAVQLLNSLAPWAGTIAVDVSDDNLALASELGAAFVVDGRENPAQEIMRITGEEGAQAVIDLVGTDSTLATAASVVARKGIVVVVGVGGGSLPFSFFGMRPESMVTTSYWGSYNELVELLDLAVQGTIRPIVHRVPLEEVNEVLDRLEQGKLTGRAVLVP